MKPSIIQLTALLLAAVLPRSVFSQGPGLGNLEYSASEVGKPVSVIYNKYGHSRAAMHRGYLVLFYSKDSGEGDGGIAFFDISNPRKPVLVHDEYNEDTWDIREAHGWGFRGDVVCVQSHTGMQFWDFSDIRKPRKIGSISLPGISKSDYDRGMWWTHWQGRYVYGGGNGSGLYIVDAEDPTDPKFVKSVPIKDLGGYRIGPTHAIGNLLILSGFDAGKSGITTLDIGDPHNPRLLSYINDLSAYSSLVNGDRLVLSARKRPLNGAVVFDVTNPAQLERMSMALTDSGGGGYVSFSDGYAFIGVPQRFSKVDMSDPTYPTVMTGASGRANADDGFVTAMGNIVFIGNDHGTGSTIIPHQMHKDMIGPKVTMVVPRNGATRQPLTTRIGLTLSELVEGSTVDTNSIKVRLPGGSALEGHFAHQTGIVNFHPHVPLLSDTTYEVFVKAGTLRDLSGNLNEADFTSTFSTIKYPVDCRLAQSSPVSSVNGAVRFTVLCNTGEVTRVTWDFGDGTQTQVSQDTVQRDYSYKKPGVYNVFAYIENHNNPVAITHTVINPPAAKRATNSSTIIIDTAARKVWNTNPDQGTVTAIDTRNLEKVHEVRVGRGPKTLAQDQGGRIWVVNQDDATISVINQNNLQAVLVPLPPSSRPYGIAFNPEGSMAYVTLEATGRVIRIKTSTLEIDGSVYVFSKPRGIAITPDGNRAYATRFISPDSSGEVAEISLQNFTLSRIIRLEHDNTPDHPNGGSGVPNALAAIAITPDGKSAWVPFKKDNVRRGLTVDPLSAPPTFESTVRTGLSVISLDDRSEIASLRLDFDNRSMANAVSFDNRGIHAFVTTGGSNHTVVINAITGQISTAIEPESLLTELSPIGVVADAKDSLLYIHYYMSREVGIYDISRLGLINAVPIRKLVKTVVNDSLPPSILRGKQIFHNASDPRMSRDRYMSCVVCHMDGGSDGRVWDFTHKGEGLRRTSTLIGKGGMAHGPVHWSANFDEIQDFENDIRDAFGGAGFLTDAQFNSGNRSAPLGDPKAGLSEELDALAAYVTSLGTVRKSPYREASGVMTNAGRAGREIFFRTDVGCATCHAPPRFTASGNDADKTLSYKSLPSLLSPSSSTVAQSFLSAEGFLLHNVGTLRGTSGQRMGKPLTGLDTPSLLGVWEGGPYLHDGSAATLMEVITSRNPNDQHGKTSHLTTLEKERLVSFLLQLDGGTDTSPPSTHKNGPGPQPLLEAKRTANGYVFWWKTFHPDVATLRIHDAKGKIIAEMKSTGRNDGEHSAFWPARHRDGTSLSPGIYYLRLTWDSGKLSRTFFLTAR